MARKRLLRGSAVRSVSLAGEASLNKAHHDAGFLIVQPLQVLQASG